MTNPTPNQTAPERIDLPNGYRLQKNGFSYDLLAPDGFNTPAQLIIGRLDFGQSDIFWREQFRMAMTAPDSSASGDALREAENNARRDRDREWDKAKIQGFKDAAIYGKRNNENPYPNDFSNFAKHGGWDCGCNWGNQGRKAVEKALAAHQPQPQAVTGDGLRDDYNLASEIYELIMDDRAGVLTRARVMQVDREQARIICKQEIAALLARHRSTAAPQPAQPASANVGSAMDAETLFQLMDDECLDLVSETHAIADTGDYDGCWFVYRRSTYPDKREQVAFGDTALEAMQNAYAALASSEVQGGVK